MLHVFLALCPFTSLGAAIISMMYDAVIRRVGSVAIPIVYSSISRGKSNCSKVAIALCGNYPKGYTIHLTESHARSYLSGGLPFLYDDPSSDTVLKPLLMNAFSGAEMGTTKRQSVAHCSPLVTANEHIIQKLSQADDRSVTKCVVELNFVCV